jgi:uncharacterized protein
MNAAASPIQRSDRIALLDTIRGVAVLGILLMNITAFGLPHAYEDPTSWGGHGGADLAVWRVMSLCFEGTFRGLFTLLFGAGALLFLERHAARDSGLLPADLYFRRTLWLIVFGFVNGYLLLWSGDILYYYGMTGLFLFVLRNARPRHLLVVALLALLVPSTMSMLEYERYRGATIAVQQAEIARMSGLPVTTEQLLAMETLRRIESDHKPAHADLQRAVNDMRADYAGAFRVVRRDTFYLESEFFLQYGFAECFGMMLLGMALFKLGILTGRASTNIYVALLVIGYAIGLTINRMELAQLEASDFSTETLLRTSLTYDAGRIPMTLGHLSLLVLLFRSRTQSAIARRLASVGQMALSNYLAQSVICLLLFTGAGFALFGELQRHELYYIVAAVWVAELLWSPWWLCRFQFGPAEWLWRSLTYRHVQPLRRARREEKEI